MGGGFLRLWTAQAVSSVGARLAREGLPMAAVISLRAGPEAIGLFAALALLAEGGFGLLAAAFAERFSKPVLMVAADLARALVLALVPLAALAHRLNLADIFIAGILMGACNVLFDVCDHAFLPALVESEALVAANARLATTDAAAEVAGPALAGALFQLVGPPLALALNAASYLASAIILAPLSRRAGPAIAERSGEAPLKPLVRGLAAVAAHPLVRPLWLADATRAFFGGFFRALYIVFAIRTLGLSTGLLGLTIAAGGAGGLIGAALAPRLEKRLGAGRAIALTAFAGALALFLIPIAGGAPLTAMAVLVVAQLVGDGLFTSLEISSTSLRQRVLPLDLLAGAAGAFRSAGALAGVAGALAGGALGAAIGARETLLIAAAGALAASLFVILSPLRQGGDPW